MEKSRKSSLHSSLARNLTSATRGAALFGVASFLFFISQETAATEKFARPPGPPKTQDAGAPSAEAPDRQSSQLENYRDLIQKAQNLTLQRDRLQASQILVRALRREPKGSTGYKELVRALEELTTVFYTNKAQSAYSAGESLMIAKPKEAIEPLQEALRLEEGNVSALRALARTFLILEDCSRAEAQVGAAEALNPPSPEVKLLRLQVSSCFGRHELLSVQLAEAELAQEHIQLSTRGIMIRELIRRGDLRKAKGVLSTWESRSPDYPELHRWKWRVMQKAGSGSLAPAVRYVQLCQNLSLRKRKSYILDVELCKEKEAADEFLRQNRARPSEDIEGLSDVTKPDATKPDATKQK